MLKNDDDLQTLRFRLIRRLIENGIKGDTIYHVLDFINIYLPFKNKEKEHTFDLEIESLIEKGKGMKTLTINDVYNRAIRGDAKRIEMRRQTLERRQKAIERRKLFAEIQQQAESWTLGEVVQTRLALEVLIRNQYNQGTSVESIAETVDLPIAFVQNIIDKNNVGLFA